MMRFRFLRAKHTSSSSPRPIQSRSGFFANRHLFIVSLSRSDIPMALCGSLARDLLDQCPGMIRKTYDESWLCHYESVTNAVLAKVVSLGNNRELPSFRTDSRRVHRFRCNYR